MGYTYSIDPNAMFEDRFAQFVALGIPQAEVSEARGAITDMWADAPGGWTFEWSKLARKHEDDGQMLLAALEYGCAKFPCLATESRRVALQQQRKAYLAAAPGFPVNFERQTLELSTHGQSISVPVHLFNAGHDPKSQPVLLLSCGVDTWKMDIHHICVTIAERLPVTVVAFDQPGTGETQVPLKPEADGLIVDLVAKARPLGNGQLAHWGISFGGNYSAMTGLLGIVDASIIQGGPIDRAFAPEALEKLPYGMRDIIGNDMGFDRQPSTADFFAGIRGLSRRELLGRKQTAPLLVINGGDDHFVPQSDVLVFEGRPKAEVHLLPGTGHCAMSELPEVMELVVRWLPSQMGIAASSQLATA